MMPQTASNVTPITAASKVSGMTGTPDIIQLRHLLFGKDYEELLALKARFENSEHYSASVSTIISEALKLRAAQDNSLSEALTPTVEQALTQSIYESPKRLATVLYPVMGPAIRKSINQALGEALATFNQMLEHGLSIRSLRWRFDAWRTGYSYAQIVLMRTLVYQVEQVFLIHRESGLLLHHVVAPNAISKGPDVISGMLTAIQDFIQDSFATDSGEELHTLCLGDLSVLIEHGPRASIAMVVRGSVPAELHQLLVETTESIHHQFARQLTAYSGETAAFADAEPLLLRCLKMQKQDTIKRTPWPAYLLLAALLGAGGYWAYQTYQTHQLRQSVLQTLKQEPGLVLLEAKQTAEGYQIKGLRDPLARQPSQLISEAVRSQLGLGFEWKPYLSMEPGLLLARAIQMLKPPQGVEFHLDGSTLQVRGESHVDWFNDLQKSWPFVAGLQALDTSQLKTSDPDQEKIAALVNSIESAAYYFDVNGSDLKQANDLRQLSQSIMELVRFAKATEQNVQITLTGHADEVGSDIINQQLVARRAQNVRNLLVAQGVPASMLVTQGLDLPLNLRKNERSVRFKVSLY